MLRVTSLDHFVLTVADIGKTVRFYVDVLGMEAQEFTPADGSIRTALMFGNQKINLHPAASPYDPKAQTPTVGSADLCFLVTGDLGAWEKRLKEQSVQIESGPIARTGATGPIMSLYVRDPDANLIEISVRA